MAIPRARVPDLGSWAGLPERNTVSFAKTWRRYCLRHNRLLTRAAPYGADSEPRTSESGCAITYDVLFSQKAVSYQLSAVSFGPALRAAAWRLLGARRELSGFESDGPRLLGGVVSVQQVMGVESFATASHGCRIGVFACSCVNRVRTVAARGAFPSWAARSVARFSNSTALSKRPASA